MGSGTGKQRRVAASARRDELKLQGTLSGRSGEIEIIDGPEGEEQSFFLIPELEERGLVDVEVQFSVEELRGGAYGPRSTQRGSKFSMRGVFEKSDRGILIQGARLSSYFDSFWDKRVKISVLPCTPEPERLIPRPPVSPVSF
jgi:hypothetical protein